MYNQNKLFRLLQLISILQTTPAKTMKSISKLIGSTERTVYRYLDLLKAVGFNVEKDSNNKIYIDNASWDIKQMFTKEESKLIRESISIVAKSSPLKDSIVKKLSINEDVTSLAGTNLLKVHLSNLVEKITKGIHERKVIVLKKYYSANSQQINDRIVEPIKFTDNYTSLVAYEISSGRIKYFNLERITDVQIKMTKMKFENKHEDVKPDVFGFGEKEKSYGLVMQMSLRAWLFLKDEYPMTIPFTKKDKKTGDYILKTTVYNLAPAKRFAKGLPGEIIFL
jgi:predicted DNA-binding transcriptional regulator YafY